MPKLNTRVLSIYVTSLFESKKHSSQECFFILSLLKNFEKRTHACKELHYFMCLYFEMSKSLSGIEKKTLFRVSFKMTKCANCLSLIRR